MRALAGVLAFVVAFAASADPATTKRWTERLKESAELLKADQHARALQIDNKLVNEMVELLGPGEAATAAFALALTHKALAHAGLGQHEDALWHWHTVLSLYPKLAGDDLSMFGKAGAFLMANRERREEATAGKADPDAKITPPTVLKRVAPKFPRAARHFAVEGQLEVEVRVALDGTISAPKIIRPLPAPTLSYTALSAVRQWRFTPAKLDGQIVPFIWNLTVNFKLN